jgi:hypothetical protein
MQQALGGGRIQRDYAQDPRRIMAQQLMQQGTSTAPVQSNLEGITRALTAGVGGYYGGEARREMEEREKLAGEQMQEILAGGQAQPWVDPDTGKQMGTAGGYPGMQAALGGIQDLDPSLQGFGAQLAMGQMEQEQAARAAEAAQQRAMELKAAPGWAAPKPPLPGRDVPYPEAVAEQLTDIAGAKAAAVRPSFEQVPGQPGVQRETRTGELKQAPLTPAQKTEAKVKALQPKAKAALQGLERQTNTVVSHIDKAVDLISPWTTGYGTILANLPETDARKLRNELDTIRANVGFDKLQSMRDASPTGGALGQVSEMENRLLQAVNGALDPGQSEQLRENLLAIKELYPQVLADRKAAYDLDYGGPQSPSDMEPLPQGVTEDDITETMKANNMTREEVLQRLGGQ